MNLQLAQRENNQAKRDRQLPVLVSYRRAANGPTCINASVSPASERT